MKHIQTRSAGARQERRERHEARLAEWHQLTKAQQLASLDGRLGAGVGAKRQRKKLS